MSLPTNKPSLFSRLAHSSSSSLRSDSSSSTTSTISSTPSGCRDYQRARYAKDGKGFDFTSTYPYSTNGQGVDETLATAVAPSFPLGCRDFKLRYAKDGKGHDFRATYTSAETASVDTVPLVDTVSSVPVPGDFKLRYAKDGKGHDFAVSYPYDKK
ncbi:hypothetical protein PV08_10968 [Exophiala spinifera]|uniref:Uncharacterized protein n=1 Tax=Exophiala spinifera TaxID=91928 RepID=A0A0D1Y9K4_9EURO|nr:uncharacterized protein PV08_10968 [Exophiala spinifera]KIW11666.1 hypothetical protein PV08_10968 [Exophiala spinifera]